MASARPAERFESGRGAEAGTYKCRGCGMRIALDVFGEMPSCPACGSTSYRRAPLFRAAEELAPPTTREHRIARGPGEWPSWLGETRAGLADGERYLVFEDGHMVRIVRLPIGWSRLGRSTTSDVRLDDPTVSRRHALVVRSESGAVRVLDDRSTNGVELNGRRIEWGTLADGDELGIGRFRIYLVALEPAGSRPAELSLAD